MIHVYHHWQSVGRSVAIKVPSCGITDQRKTLLLQPEGKVILVISSKQPDQIVFYYFMESLACGQRSWVGDF